MKHLVQKDLVAGLGLGFGAMGGNAVLPWSVDFTGKVANSGITVGNAASVNDLHAGAFTVESWLYPHSYGDANISRIWDKSANSSLGWEVYYDVTRITAKVFCDTTSPIVFYTTSEFNTDRHLAITYDNLGDRKLRIFYNGSLVATSAAAGVGNIKSDAGTPLYFGRRVAGGRMYDGAYGWSRISNIARYTTAFTPTARNVFPDVDANTIRLFKINEGTGAVIADSSSNAVNASMSSGTWVRR